MTAPTLSRAAMEKVIRTYYDGCNEADEAKMIACFVPEAVHYFPAGMYGGAFRGAAQIAHRWRTAVETLGSYWTIDALVIDAETAEAAIEWTHFKTNQDKVLRGAECVEFDRASGLIREIRAFYASPQAEGIARLELGDFDYAGRGYRVTSPRKPA
ncbi:nuclear transport factor 2 family protein [Methylibium sp. Pch-M]|jgi:hypothetical protein|uniref:SnoaL-like domain-containing protein n=2 Tax=Methylibium petroleiphilum (strain ATCC BAA-1232 / LMG 22953 / PM1) TaxID=420662 RepID=A2SL15_METPP|nr:MULTISPECIES: nuclear transport factor 2 family protein [Methylibium]ABM96254.1 hypothetical protein Mpe_A3301 [Methylibium petroleiphilum PM1]QAZ39065.1 nuclear transport factor 2 family protein [Methylibium sp. Pch-M]